MGRLDRKVALVTGGASGIGRAITRRFAAEGASVVLTDIADDAGRSVANDLGPAARYHHLDVTDENEWHTIIEATTTELGAVHVLVNNAGVVDGAPLQSTSLASYRRVIDVNQTGVFLGMRSVVEPMTAAGGGSIVNISSIDGLVGAPNIVSYVASKWAVRGMTKAAAIELAPVGIRVNSIHPGFVHTEIGARPDLTAHQIHAQLDAFTAARAPMARAGNPDEIAQLAVFVASDESSYSTGSEFVADGGFTSGHPSPGSP